MIYLNNAGTSWPKPAAVGAAVRRVERAEPDAWSELFDRALRDVTAAFGIEDRERFLFTPGCTSALAVAIADLPWQEGDVVLTSALEHHALARPVAKLALHGVRHEILPYRPGEPVDLDAARHYLRTGRVRLVAFTMASNVTGELLPAAELVALAHEYDALCLVDAAQTAGVLRLDVRELGADVLTFAGHKGPLAPQGIGGLWIAPGVELLSPAASCDVGAGEPGVACAPFPSYCDLGSVNLAAAAGLAAGLRWLEDQGYDVLRERALDLTTRFLDGLEQIPGIEVQGGPDPAKRTAVVSVTHRDLTPQTLETRLRERGVIVRGGQHCAPMAHDALGTGAPGTLRFSLGPMNTRDDVEQALAGLRDHS